jgi:hypothetical protein
MPRKSRIDAPGALHHIICRGIERNARAFHYPLFLHYPSPDGNNITYTAEIVTNASG